MVTTREQQAFDRAVEAARQKATLETLAELRAFTGIEAYEPDHTAPEHVAYLGYEQDLANGLQVWTGHEVSSRENVDRLIERRNAASRAVDEELERRTAERADRNVAVRVLGKVQDLAIRERAHLRDVEKRLEDAWADLHHAEDRVREIQTELYEVGAWLEEMYVSVEASRVERQEQAARERLEAEHARRDTSPLGFQVFSPQEFVDADGRRLAHQQPDHFVLDGLSFPGRWRRDEDDDFNDEGAWSLMWNPTTRETFLERAGYGRQPEVWLLGTRITTQDAVTDFEASISSHRDERNSLAVVLEAYRRL
ncbi:hypothetical protein [Clavibacter sp. VKM Ac-2872]|uniref:hypothetical protein n=1 Tax=Clavibacter sp. VKM Ac-2872 TaxID=2783812 RepID=UPI001E55643B|nr:hypothetical protein [Clavibacter sp. VKM Ac-2872]